VQSDKENKTSQETSTTYITRNFGKKQRGEKKNAFA
jgi:hypothetical protein